MSRSMFSMALSTVALMALPGTGTGTTSPAPALSATVEQCVTAAARSGRSVTFVGEMETVAGAQRMAMQIDVQEHTPEEAGFHTLTAGGLGTWERSETGVKIYKYVRQVTDLPAPAAFRAIVMYRWLNEKDRVIRRDERRTPICRQLAERAKPSERAKPATGTEPAAAGPKPTT
jgi:hypothetical protein